METSARASRSRSPRWIGFGLGIAYGCALRFLATAEFLEAVTAPEVVSFTFIFLVPAAIGGTTVALGSASQRASYVFRLFAPWVAVLGTYLVFLVTATETIVCLVMLFPASAIASSLGGLIAGWVRSALSVRSSTTLSCFVLLPFAIYPLERLAPVSTTYRTVETRLVVHAPRERVWNSLTSVEDIRDDELQWSFSHAIGIPKPRAALLSSPGMGGVRDIYWDQGIHFVERIDSWNEKEGFTYKVDATPAAHALKVLDTHVVIGDRYFDVLAGGYALQALPDGETLLTLRTTYRISSRVNFYGLLWADFVLDDFHNVVMKVVGSRAEKDADA